MALRTLNCSRLQLLFVSTNRIKLARCQHETKVANLSNSLPPNLVLFGISKENVIETVPFEDALPPDANAPVIRHCIKKIPPNKRAIKVWADSLLDDHPECQNAVELHPLIFGVHPRMDILHEVVKWQKNYREVDYAWSRSRAEMGRGKKKPWPQKGTGKKRQGSTTPPFWKNGGICHGPRGPRSLFYQLSDDVLIKGLTIALTVKLIQNDLIFVETTEIEEPNPDCLDDFIRNRNLSDSSMLFVHAEKKHPDNLSQVLEHSRKKTLMPAYALNVYSILKHDKLILPIDCLDDLETKLIWHLTKYRWHNEPHNFYKDMPGTKELKKEQEMFLSRFSDDDFVDPNTLE